ncbi:hypothetical protein CI789_09145 [Erwinia persicina]|nr:hypothetical protein CI789_09145 [Erwinia persicina]
MLAGSASLLQPGVKKIGPTAEKNRPKAVNVSQVYRRTRGRSGIVLPFFLGFLFRLSIAMMGFIVGMITLHGTV